MGTTNNNIIDLSALKKREYKVGDKTLELDTADLKILARFEKMYPVLLEEGSKVAEFNKYIKDGESEIDDIDGLANAIDEVDTAMRNAIDFIFDSNVCEVCVDHGSLFDFINGQARFEHIIDALIPLYEKNLQEETKKIQQRVKKHTDKYTKAEKK